MVLTLVCLVGVVGCQDDQTSKKELENVAIRGQVERVNDNGMFVEEDGYNHTLALDFDKDVEDVEGDLESKYNDTIYSVAQISKGDATSVLKNGEEVGFDVIEKGMKVEVSFTGPIQESYPVQATAGVIQILEN